MTSFLGSPSDGDSRPFVETSVARRILDTIQLAQEMRTNAAIVGAPGVGKTAALKAFAAKNRHAYLFTVTQVLSGSLQALLRALCDELGVVPGGSIHDVESRLLKFYYSTPVVILDEAQNLPLKSLRQLLHLSVADEGDIVFIFCGNSEVLKRVNTDQGAFAQISRRVPFRETVDSIQDEDADLLTNSFGVEGLDAYEMMRSLGAAFHAGGIVDVLKAARRFSETPAIRAENIRDAIDLFPPQYRAALQGTARTKRPQRTA